MPTPHVLVFMQYCPESVGEQIVQIPFFTMLRKVHPGARIVGVSPDSSSALIERMELADEVHIYPNKANWGTLAGMARRLRRLPCVAAYQHRHRSMRTALFARLCTAAPIHGFTGGLTWFNAVTRPWERQSYIAQNYLDLIDLRIGDFVALEPREDRGYVAIIPAGRRALKKYPLDRYIRIARTLGEKRPVRFLLGPDMKEELEHLEPLASEFRLHVGAPMPEIEEIVRGSSLTIANDCGPAHFAQIHDVPRIVIFDARIRYRHWNHPSPSGRILVEEGIERIPVERVLRETRDLLQAASPEPTPAR